MMLKKSLLLLLFLILPLFGNIYDIPKEVKIEGKFAKSKRCVRCHLDIYLEFKNSKHNLSNILTDDIHKAMWKANPLSKEKKYICATCHAPTAKGLKKLKEGKATLSKKEKTHLEGVSCAFCHRIKSIEKHNKKYKYILNNKKREYYGTRVAIERSEFHDINITNKEFKIGNSCLACHSQHSRNKQLVLKKDNKKFVGYCVYSKLDKPNQDKINNKKQNCITCHMPQVEGSLSDRVDTKTHAYHGFAGISNDMKMLQKYVKLDIKREKNRFDIIIKNLSPHDLLLHPIRGLEIKVFINDKIFKKMMFKKESAVFDVAPLAWLEKNITYKNSIKANSSKIVSFEYTLKKDDIVKVKLYYHKIREEIAKKVNFKSKKDNVKLFKERVFKGDL